MGVSYFTGYEVCWPLIFICYVYLMFPVLVGLVGVFDSLSPLVLNDSKKYNQQSSRLFTQFWGFLNHD